MAKDPAVLFYIGDWLKSTAEMDSDTRGWYLNLILHNYDKKDLPDDLEKLAQLAGVRFSEYHRFEQVFEQVLKQKFEQTPEGRLTNPIAFEIMQGREMFLDKRSRSGKISYFLKFIRSQHPKNAKDVKFIMFVKDNLDTNSIDLKDKQVLEQMFEQMFELYTNENENENVISNNNSLSKKEIKLNRILEAENKFKESVEEFIPIYGEDMCKEFSDYWTEPNISKTKLKFEMLDTWDISRRLKKWSSNQDKFKPVNGSNIKQSKNRLKDNLESGALAKDMIDKSDAFDEHGNLKHKAYPVGSAEYNQIYGR